MQLHTRKTIQTINQGSWESAAFSNFEAAVSSTESPFPCTLGVAGFNADQLRYAFIDSDPVADQAITQLSGYLQSFLTASREFGKNTSLVVFFNELGDLGVTHYEDTFWGILNRLTQLDTKPWPRQIPHDTNLSTWEFSFGGEPIFVVCNTPSHKLRRSRYGAVFNITFQPRWVFEEVIGPGSKNGEKITAEIRRRLADYDQIPPSPHLGSYGVEGNLEWRQYYLGESNEDNKKSCPFHHGWPAEEARVVRTATWDLEQVIAELSPHTGSVEVQFDTPFRRHSPHWHPTDETLHIISGGITFEVGEEKLTCGPGDRLLLPRNTLHASTAGKEGCRYVIATRLTPIHMKSLAQQEVSNA